MYNKLFTKILDSSIWLEDASTRLVWLTMIAAMDETGFCQFASPANLAHRARVPQEDVNRALACLEGSDDQSSDPDNEGRRVERVPGGWMVLNAPKYRALVTKLVIQEQTAARVKRHREMKRGCNAPVTQCNASETPSGAEAGAEANTNTGDLLSVPPKEWTPNEEQRRLNALFNRRESTKWSKAELSAWKAITPIADEDFRQVERYYKARIPVATDYRRRDLCTLLNNWNGEVDRARQFKAPSIF